MNNRIDTGGMAFPLKEANTSDAMGMTLREYYAGQAMQAIVSSIDSEEGYLRLRAHALPQGMSVSEWIANDAFKQADAMIARSKLP